MSEFDISRLDLNLLRTLHVLIEEKNVSRAADRLSLSQSAVSHALARLRDQLEDPLFIRNARGIEPTRRTLELAGPLRQILAGIDQLVGRVDFDPASIHTTLRIAATDFGAAIVVPPILEQIAAEGPNVNVQLQEWSEQTLADLKSGFLDIALGVGTGFPDFETDTLFTESFVSVVRKNHPASRGILDLESYLSYGHVQVDIVDSRMKEIDAQLAQLGRRRNIRLTLTEFLAVPFIISQTNLVGTLPTRIAETILGSTGLEILQLPVEVEPFPYVQVWHKNRENDQVHQWIRQMIRSIYVKSREITPKTA